MATPVGVFLTYCSYLKHDVVVSFEVPAFHQYVSGMVTVRGYVSGRPYDRLVIELDGHPYQWESFPFVLDTTLLPDGLYTLRCLAFHKHQLIASAHVQFYVVNTLPTVSFFYPKDGDVLGGVVDIIVGTEQGLPLDNVELLLNGRVPVNTLRLDTTKLPDGYHTLSAIVTNRAGLTGRADVGFFVDNTPPRILSLGLEHLSAHKDAPLRGRIRLRPTIEEENISQAEWYVNDVLVSTELSLTFDTTELEDGEHTIRLIVYDRARWRASHEAVFSTDNTPPVVQWSVPDGQVPLVLPQWATLYVDVISEDSDIVEVTHYANGHVIKPGWLPLNQFAPGSQVVIETLVRDRAGNVTLLKKVVHVADSVTGSFLNIIRPIQIFCNALAFRREKLGLRPPLGFVVRPSFLICPESDTPNLVCDSTSPLWLEFEAAPLLMFGPSSLLGGGFGIYLNPDLLEKGLLPARVLLKAGSLTSVTVLERLERATRVHWYNLGWIALCAEHEIKVTGWLTMQWRLGIAYVVLYSIVGYEGSSYERPGGLRPPPQDRISEEQKATLMWPWWAVSLRIPLY